MNYLFYGKDSGKIQKEINQVISDIKETCDVITYDLYQSKLQDVIQELTMNPFFSEKKVIIVKHCDFLSSSSIDTDLTYLERFLNQPILENILIMTGEFEKCDSRKKIVKLINQTCKVKSCQNLEEKDKRTYVIEKCRELNIKLNSNDLSFLIQRLELDTRLIDLELEKLSNYPDKLNEEILSSLILKPLEDNIFQLCESIIKGSFKKAFSLYKDMRSLNYDPIYLISVLSSQFRFYYQVKVCLMKSMSEETIASYLKAHPYRVKLTSQIVRNIKVDKIMKLIEKCSQCDIDIKTGVREKNLAFEMFLIECQEVMR